MTDLTKIMSSVDEIPATIEDIQAQVKATKFYGIATLGLLLYIAAKVSK